MAVIVENKLGQTAKRECAAHASALCIALAWVRKREGEAEGKIRTD